MRLSQIIWPILKCWAMHAPPPSTSVPVRELAATNCMLLAARQTTNDPNILISYDLHGLKKDFQRPEG